jgi:hypothetical protein
MDTNKPNTNKKIPHEKFRFFRRLLYAFDYALKLIVGTRHGHMAIDCLATQAKFSV